MSGIAILSVLCELRLLFECGVGEGDSVRGCESSCVGVCVRASVELLRVCVLVSLSLSLSNQRDPSFIVCHCRCSSIDAIVIIPCQLWHSTGTGSSVNCCCCSLRIFQTVILELIVKIFYRVVLLIWNCNFLFKYNLIWIYREHADMDFEFGTSTVLLGARAIGRVCMCVCVWRWMSETVIHQDAHIYLYLHSVCARGECLLVGNVGIGRPIDTCCPIIEQRQVNGSMLISVFPDNAICFHALSSSSIVLPCVSYSFIVTGNNHSNDVKVIWSTSSTMDIA